MTPQAVFLVRPSRQTLGAVLFLGMVYALLLWSYSHPLRYSDWSFGDAQTMTALEHWNQDGWARHYGLGIYNHAGPVTALLDRPGLRRHAMGNSERGWRSPQRLYYTHYPPGYKLPYFAAQQAGFREIHQARAVAVTLSVVALGLFYLLLRQLPLPEPVALMALVFYGLSRPFVEFAGSLANMPMDDLLRFAFLLLSLSLWRHPASRWRLVGLAVLAAMLMLCSLDSIFFIFIWTLLLDPLHGRALGWRRPLVIGAAMAGAYALLLGQNAWYLGGLTHALQDHFGSILDAGVNSALHGGPTTWSYWDHTLRGHLFRFLAQGVSLLTGFHLTDLVGYESVRFRHPWVFGAGSALMLAMLIMVWRGQRDHFRWMMALLVCGLAYALVFSNLSKMHYQVRQVLPFFSLLVALAFHHVWQRVSPGAGRRLVVVAGVLLLVVVAAGFTQSITAREHIMRRSHDPVPVSQRLQEVHLARQLGALATPYPKVFLDVRTLREQIILQESEWELNALVLYFADDRIPKTPRKRIPLTREEKLVRDLGQILREDGGRYRGTFSPVVLADHPGQIARVRELLAMTAGLQGGVPEAVQHLQGAQGGQVYWQDLTALVAGLPVSAETLSITR
ncbi:MAG: hypothetical protein H7831_08050 [Magnetococcus sp. WYHC-3]